MMEVEGLVAGYGRIGVLDGVSLAVGAGACVGVLGHNGAGKTTLLKALMGLLPVWRGSVRFDGRALERAPPHVRARAGLGYVPQGRRIFPALSVLDNLRFAQVAAGLGQSAVDEALREFPELSRLLERPGGALSGGEQQLLALARALVARPRLLLLDEPTEGIQPSIIHSMAARIRGLRESRGLAVLLVEQNLDFIRSLSDRVLLMQRGRIMREMPAAQLDDPALEQEFIGA